MQLTEDQKAFVRQGIERGQYSSEEDALRYALSLWEQRERYLEEIRAAIAKAEASAARGEGRIISSREESRQLAVEINARGSSAR